MSRTVKQYEISASSAGGKNEKLIINYRITDNGPWKSLIVPYGKMFAFMEQLNAEWESTDRYAEAYL